MTTETIQAPVAAAPATATVATPEPASPQPGEQTEALETAAEELGNAEPGEDDPNSETEEDKVQAEVDKATRKARRRIDRLIADRAALATDKARLEAELLEAKKPANPDGTKPPTAEDPHEIARQMRIVEKTAEATAKVMTVAKAKFPDFEATIAELVEEIGPQIDKHGRPTPLMEAVLDSDRAGELLNYLGKNTELAAELVGLSQARIGRRIAQIENDLAAQAKPKPSAAAKPLSPVKPSAPILVDETKLSDAQWYAARRKAKEAE